MLVVRAVLRGQNGRALPCSPSGRARHRSEARHGTSRTCDPAPASAHSHVGVCELTGIIVCGRAAAPSVAARAQPRRRHRSDVRVRSQPRGAAASMGREERAGMNLSRASSRRGRAGTCDFPGFSPSPSAARIPPRPAVWGQPRGLRQQRPPWRRPPAMRRGAPRRPRSLALHRRPTSKAPGGSTVRSPVQFGRASPCTTSRGPAADWSLRGTMGGVGGACRFRSCRDKYLDVLHIDSMAVRRPATQRRACVVSDIRRRIYIAVDVAAVADVLGTHTHTETRARTRTHAHTDTRAHTQTRARTRTHTHTSVGKCQHKRRVRPGLPSSRVHRPTTHLM